AILHLRVAGQPAHAPGCVALRVHRAVLAAYSEYFRARLLRWTGSASQTGADFQPTTTVTHFAETGSLPPGLTLIQLAQCDVAHLVVRCMYEGELAEDVKDPLTLARVCRVAERWAFLPLSSSCLQRLADLPPSQLPAERLVLVLQTLPDSCALLPEHKKWQQVVLCLILSLFGLFTSAQLRTTFQQLPFAAVQQWAGSDALTVDSENSVVELISLWMAGSEGQACSKEQKQKLSSLVRVQHLSLGLTSWPSHPQADQLHHAVLTVHCQRIAACPLLRCCKGQLLESCPQLGAGDDGVDIPKLAKKAVEKLLPLLVLRQQVKAVRQ
ncbi:BTB domain-containing protein, partial [Haematococcus lacustris]